MVGEHRVAESEGLDNHDVTEEALQKMRTGLPNVKHTIRLPSHHAGSTLNKNPAGAPGISS
jgi:hypothetical protein